MSAEAPLPPPDLAAYVGDGEYRQVGRAFRDHFVRLGGLRPGDRVLDVGCGSGRMALPLTEYLSPEGSYEGFDIVAPAVEWCQKTITPAHPNFRFRHADVFNAFYNPTGKVRPRCFRFPYPDASFDFAFLTSVFTHLLPDDLDNYLAEVSRVLNVGGRCFATFFLTSAETAELLRAGKGRQRFPYTYGRRGEQPVGRNPAYGDCFTETKDGPEQAVAYEEGWVADRFAACGFDLRPVEYGAWPGRERFADFQDIVVATKARQASASFRLRRGLKLLPLRESLWRLRQFGRRLRRPA